MKNFINIRLSKFISVISLAIFIFTSLIYADSGSYQTLALRLPLSAGIGKDSGSKKPFGGRDIQYVVKGTEMGVSFLVPDPYRMPDEPEKINLESIASGAGLVRAYERLLEINKRETALPVVNSENILNRAKDAFNKNENQRDAEDKDCLRVILTSIEKLAEGIAEKVNQRKEPEIRIVLFGGVGEGGGEFYRGILEENVDRILLNTSKKVDIQISTMKDSRAIIGAVGYRLFVLNKKPTGKKYAIGIDLGGTKIRAAKVNLETMQIEGDIVSVPMLPADAIVQGKSAPEQMSYISKKLAQKCNKEAETKPNYFDVNELPDGFDKFLSDPEDIEIHNELSAILLNQLRLLINSFDPSDIDFISIASAGIFGTEGPVKLAYNLPLTGVDLRRELGVDIGNDVDCGAVGEKLAGIGKDRRVVFALNIGTGLNMSVVEQTSDKANSSKFAMGIENIPSSHDMLQEALVSGLITKDKLLDLLDKEDNLITSIRISMYMEMVRGGAPKDRAFEIAKGVIRSLYDEDCEIMAASDLADESEVVIGGKFGGTSFKLGAITHEGEFKYKADKKDWKDASGGKKGTELSLGEVVSLLGNEIIGVIEHTPDINKSSIKVGISACGQTENPEGWGRIAGYGKTAPNLPVIENESLAELIEGFLNKKGYENVQVSFINDSYARIKGELSKQGTLGKDNLRSGSIVILGTGVNTSMAINGNVVTDGLALRELGNTVLTPTDFNPLVDGLINMAYQWKGLYPSDEELNKMGVQRVEVVTNSKGLSELAGLFGFSIPGYGNNLPDATEAALKQDKKALELVELYGLIVGKYLASMALERKGFEKPWVEHIVLVSGIGEKFAKGAKVPEDRINQALKNADVHKTGVYTSI